jgi:hypothetical protein
MLAQPVAGALDVDDHGVVQQPVEQRGCDHRIAENLPPFGKAAIGGQDHGAALVARIDQLKEQIAGTGTDAQVADLVDNQQRRAAEKADPFAQAALAFGAGKAVDDIGERGELDAAPGPHRLNTEADRQVTLSGTGLANEMNDLVPVDEVERGQRHDPAALERWLVLAALKARA